MIWQPETIKELRLKLGWSKAEFGRRFGGKIDLVEAWESGQKFPTADDIDQFETLAMQLKDYSQELRASSLSRQNMKQRAVNQISNSEIEGIAEADLLE